VRCGGKLAEKVRDRVVEIEFIYDKQKFNAERGPSACHINAQGPRVGDSERMKFVLLWGWETEIRRGRKAWIDLRTGRGS
jgi:hypothetical protein